PSVLVVGAVAPLSVQDSHLRPHLRRLFKVLVQHFLSDLAVRLDTVNRITETLTTVRVHLVADILRLRRNILKNRKSLPRHEPDNRRNQRQRGRPRIPHRTNNRRNILCAHFFTALLIVRLVHAPTTPFCVSARDARDRKSTRLNSSHVKISYAVFCLKKK